MFKLFKRKEAEPAAPKNGGLKLNYSRTALIGFAFFGILLLWQDGQHSKYAANRRNSRIEIRNDNHHDCRGNNDNAQ